MSTPIEPASQPANAADTPVRERPLLDRKEIVNREKEEFGGIKVGSAFFGWLTATGTAVLLTALLGAMGAAVTFATETPAGEAAAANAGTIGLASGIALLVVLFISYYCGGYVAGRMARFQGMRQGLAVWVWGVIITIAAAALVGIAGAQYNVLSTLNLPRIPVNEGSVTTAGIIALLAIAAATLLGAIAGGLAGMRFHRRVDKAGLTAPTD